MKVLAIVIVAIFFASSDLFAFDNLFKFDMYRFHKKKVKDNLEFSVGGITYFVNQIPEDGNINSDEEVSDINGALVLFEFLLTEATSIILNLSIPTQDIRKVDQDKVIEKRMNPSLGLGAGFSLLRFKFLFRSFARIQFGGIYSASLNTSKNEDSYTYPLAFIRFHILSRRDFTIYVGGAYAFKRKIPALLYGVGRRF